MVTEDGRGSATSEAGPQGTEQGWALRARELDAPGPRKRVPTAQASLLR